MTPVRASILSQTAKTRVGFCSGVVDAARVAFYGEGTWEQIETAHPIQSLDEAASLVRAANHATEALNRICRKERA